MGKQVSRQAPITEITNVNKIHKQNVYISLSRACIRPHDVKGKTKQATGSVKIQSDLCEGSCV